MEKRCGDVGKAKCGDWRGTHSRPKRPKLIESIRTIPNVLNTNQPTVYVTPFPPLVDSLYRCLSPSLFLHTHTHTWYSPLRRCQRRQRRRGFSRCRRPAGNQSSCAFRQPPRAQIDRLIIRRCLSRSFLPRRLLSLSLSFIYIYTSILNMFFFSSIVFLFPF